MSSFYNRPSLLYPQGQFIALLPAGPGVVQRVQASLRSDKTIGVPAISRPVNALNAEGTIEPYPSMNTVCIHQRSLFWLD
jgi:hypothetical protein